MKRKVYQQITAKTFQAKEFGVFYKSSFSGASNCVAIATFASGAVRVRDTKDVMEKTLEFKRDEWAAFIQGVKNNEFDV